MPLTPDASDRRYMRVIPPRGPSQVLAVYPGPIDYAQMPFALVATLFAGDAGAGAARAGPRRRAGHRGAAGPGRRHAPGAPAAATAAGARALYEEAVAIIATLQRRGAELATPAPVPYGLAFDVPKLTFELDFFATHFLEGHRGVALAGRERTALAEEFAALAGELSSSPGSSVTATTTAAT